MHDETRAFWERPEVVERFASREPDARLKDWLSKCERPRSLRVLDIGCAGGRNAELLAELGCDLHAIDASEAMVRRTRLRVGFVIGEREAARRIRLGRMENLGAFADRSFDLVLALGVYHSAPDRHSFELAIAESSRVLDEGGELLLASFAPGTALEGIPWRPLPEEPGVHVGHESGRHYLLDAADLDELLARFDLLPVEPTRTVQAGDESSVRITVNGWYRKGPREQGVSRRRS
ncbi:MAG: class I SAM-dependent methyltransferase [marine benthic group bacterium]|jgi:SAM-dependent methyltransferase|nr:class I SAM-dependent methyltransferase [Gemmatimonadota bacterium]MCL7974501.1 class I SAM-dependent methyltransferase [Gemmatimonadota bacterium]